MRVPITKNDIVDNFFQPRNRSKPRRLVLEHYPLRTLDREAGTIAHKRVHYPLKCLGFSAKGNNRDVMAD